MLLFVGLGNPGLQYSETRHNVGFNLVSSISRFCNADLVYKQKFDADIASSSLDHNKLLFLKPMTYMNLSGLAVHSVKEYYKIPIQNIIVIHDDIDVDLGKVKVKIGGGSAGHNGIKSIDNSIGNEYIRIRIGVGRPKENCIISNWVLENFSKNERLVLDRVIKMVLDNLKILLKKDIIEINKVFAGYNNGI
jgi:PTH1 family peptidyl-tRNA hydrolase